MKTRNAILVLVLIGIGFSSCKKGGLCRKGNGTLKTEVRAASDFIGVDLQMSADVIITKGENYEVTVETDENLQRIIETKVKGNVLMIDLKRGKCISGREEITIYVTTPTLRSAEVSGSGNLTLSGSFSENKLDLDISGSGDINNTGDLSIDDLDLNISGSGNVRFTESDIAKYDLNISGSGNVNIEGEASASNGEIKINGSGEVNLFDYETTDLSVNISGSGDVNAFVTEFLDVDINGSGDVNYIGTPRVSVSISGSGEIRDVN